MIKKHWEVNSGSQMAISQLLKRINNMKKQTEEKDGHKQNRKQKNHTVGLGKKLIGDNGRRYKFNNYKNIR